MSWNQLTLDVPDDLKDAVIGELDDNDVTGIWESEAPVHGQTRLVVYLRFRSDISRIEKCILSVFSRNALDSPSIQRSVVEDRDWTEEWKKSYVSFPIGDSFFLIPSWEATLCPDDRLPIRIDPGQAFGTGTHETTQLSVEALERWVDSDQLVLDLGTGSGILAIASRLLGAKAVFACDIDSVAVQVAQANIDRNAEDEVWTFCGSVAAVRSHSIRLVLANLTADLIMELFPEIDRVLQPGGIVVLSGILSDQLEEVREVFRNFAYSVYEEIARGEWVAFVIGKHVA